MTIFRSALLSSLLSFILVGCQSLPKTTTTETPQQATNLAPTAIQQFKITGKIGVRTSKQNGSAFYGWHQTGDQFAIDLTGALGIGQTLIRGKTGDVSLTSSKTGTLHANTPEALLYQATGWEAPITYLTSWINARAATPSAVLQKDNQHRIALIQEGGWSAHLSYADTENLPNKLVLIDDAQQNRVTLTIQTRE